MAGRVILVRHGQTHSNVGRFLDTRPPGAELTPEGRRQAQDVGAELADYSGDRLAHMYSSVALRAQQTAMLAASAFDTSLVRAPGTLPVDVAPGIHEIFAGDYEMRGDADAHRLYAEALGGWLHSDASARLPGGEGIHEVLGRYRPTLEELIARHHAAGPEGDRDIAVVSHGAAIRIVATHATGTDPGFAFRTYLGNCRFIVLEPQGRPFGQWDVVRWTDGPLPVAEV